MERAVAPMWPEVLGIPAAGIGRHDNFFELGGDSLLMLAFGSIMGGVSIPAGARAIRLAVCRGRRS
jgi:hypothetical protein